MSLQDWKRNISEAINRIQRRYDYIGRKTGVPFLAIMYPSSAEVAVFNEWDTQTRALKPGIDVKTIDLLEVTQTVLSDIGVGTVVDSLNNKDWALNAQEDLTQLWVTEIAKEVRLRMMEESVGKPVLCIKHLAALYPVSGPRDIMERLWNDPESTLDCPIVVFIPGVLTGPRHYRFLDKRDEFMYRGDLL